jgi:membrane protein implicated in regulation of membrane protease activity
MIRSFIHISFLVALAAIMIVGVFGNPTATNDTEWVLNFLLWKVYAAAAAFVIWKVYPRWSQEDIILRNIDRRACKGIDKI